MAELSLVYGITALQKHTPAWRETFDAVYYSLNNDLIASRLGVALGGAPRGLLRGLTVFTLAAEVALPFLLLAPLRSPRVRLFGVLLSGSLQVGFFLCFDVGIFPFVSTAAVLPFLPSFALDALARRPPLRRAHGRLVGAAERWIRPTSRAPSAAPVSPWGRTVAASLCAAGIGAVVASNLSSVGAFALPAEATKALSVLRLGQGWMMFASPSTQAGWYVALGKRTDGHVVDLLHPGEDVRWDKPAHVSSAFASRDERKLFSILRADAAKPYRAGVSRYLCALPQGEGAPPLRAIRLHFRARPIGGSGQEEPTDTLVLHDKCPRGARDPESVAAR